MRYRGLVLALCLLILSNAPAMAQSPAPMPNMIYELSWKNHTRTPGWAELQVTFTNDMGDWEGEVHIQDPVNEITYRKALVLPAHSRKHYRIPLFQADNAYFQIYLVDKHGNAQQAENIVTHPVYERRFCVVADTTGSLDISTFDACFSKLLIQDFATLPETPLAWDAIDVLLLNGVPSSDLTTAQQQALLAWVGAGGHLVLSGGAALPQTLAQLPKRLQIATPKKTHVFEQLVLADDVVGTLSATPLSPQTQVQPLLTAGQTMLAVRRQLGQGLVDVLGWDITHTPDSAWIPMLWDNDPAPAVRAPFNPEVALDAQNTPNTYGLLQIPYNALPNFWKWLIIFPLYIILMGPGTWLIVRRLHRPVLTWLILPFWMISTLIILALGLNGQFSQTFPLTHQIANIYQPGPGLPARVTQGIAIYAPRARKVTWHTTGLARPLQGQYVFNSWYGEGEIYPLHVRYQDSSSSHEKGAKIDVSRPLGIITWGTAGLIELPSIETALNITTQNNQPLLVGTLQSQQNLREVSLVLGNGQYNFSIMETVTQGHTLAITQYLTQARYLYEDYARICARSNYPVSYPIPLSGKNPDPRTYTDLTASSACYITGLVDGVPFPVESLGGTHIAHSCVIHAIPCPTQSPGSIHIPLQNVPSQIENGWADEDHILYISWPETTVPYILPSFLKIQEVQSLTLDFGPPLWQSEASFDLNTTLKTLAMWDWQQQSWVTQTLPIRAQSITLTGEQAQPLFDPSVGLKLKLEPQEQSGTNISIMIMLEGSW